MKNLHSAEGLQRASVAATDGELGHVDDMYFDDQKWAIRYVVIDTGGWLNGRKVLVSPAAVAAIVVGATGKPKLSVDLTREQIQNSPSIDTAKPVSRQNEIEFNRYYDYPYYWTGPYLWGYTVLPAFFESKPFEDPERQELRARMEAEQARADPALRSTVEIGGYKVRTADGATGHVDDLLFDPASWKIELIAVDTRDWWPSKHVLIAPSRISSVDWTTSSIIVNVTRQQLDESPEYEPGKSTVRRSLEDLYRYVRRV